MISKTILKFPSIVIAYSSDLSPFNLCVLSLGFHVSVINNLRRSLTFFFKTIFVLILFESFLSKCEVLASLISHLDIYLYWLFPLFFHFYNLQRLEAQSFQFLHSF